MQSPKNMQAKGAMNKLHLIFQKILISMLPSTKTNQTFSLLQTTTKHKSVINSKSTCYIRRYHSRAILSSRFSLRIVFQKISSK